MESTADEVKARTDIVDVISSYIQVKKAGANFKARCPFHDEKTASFMISTAKQIWHCFGCNKGGDVFSFLMEKDGLEFGEALKLCADRAGIKLPAYDAARQSERSQLVDIIKSAEYFFCKSLNSQDGATARAYLANRGMHHEIAAEFGIGYAPALWDALVSALRGKYKEQDLATAGLVTQKVGGSRYYDRFRNRIMIPLRDFHGTTIGFTGRILESAAGAPSDSANEAKYLNTPETPIFKKGLILFGLDRAKNAIREAKSVILVEGNMDVITCHAFGMQNVVAPSGTALTPEQLRLIARFTDTILFCFDADKAGQNAMQRGTELARQEGLHVKVIHIPKEGGKDPDECIRKRPDLWKAAVENAISIMDHAFQRTLENMSLENPENRSRVVAMLIPELALLPTLTEQDYWIKELANKMKMDARILWEELKKVAAMPFKKQTIGKEKTLAMGDRMKILSERLLALLIANPTETPTAIAALPMTMIAPGELQGLYQNLIEWYTTHTDHENPAFYAWLSQKGALETISAFDALEMLAQDEWVNHTIAEQKKEIQNCLVSIRAEYIQRRREELQYAMQNAERTGNPDAIAQVTKDFEDINALI